MKRVLSIVIITLLFVGTLTMPLKAQEGGAGIYIRADGSIDPPTAPINRNGNVYTLTGNASGAGLEETQGIAIERDNMTLDGAGYTLTGEWEAGAYAIYLSGRANVTIRNFTIVSSGGIYAGGCSNIQILQNNIGYGRWCGFDIGGSNNTVYGNTIRDRSHSPISIDGDYNNFSSNNVDSSGMVGSADITFSGSHNTLSGNNISGSFWFSASYSVIFRNNISGIIFTGSYNLFYENNIGSFSDHFQDLIVGSPANNKFYHNNFGNLDQEAMWSISNNVWDDGYPSGGNYWTGYTGVDKKSGPNQDQPGNDGIGDTPYIIYSNNKDRYPLIKSFEDGFESGDFSAWTTSFSSGETASISSTIAYRGAFSAKFTSNGGGGIEYTYCSKKIGASTDFYARGCFYVSQLGIVEDNDRFFFLIFKAGANNVAYAGWRRTGGVVKWILTTRSGSGYVDVFSSSAPVLNRWYCVELHWKEDPTSGYAEMWVDGARVCSATNRNTAYFGDVTSIRFGLPEIDYCTNTTVYCDNARASFQYIGPDVSSYSFEDGFESGNLKAWSGSSLSTGETVAAVKTRCFRGVGSSRFTTNGGGGIEYARIYKTIVPSSDVYARGYFYVSQSGIVDETDRFFFMVFQAAGNNIAYAGWRRSGGAVRWVLTARSGTGYVDIVATSTSSPVLNRWYCVELHWKKGSVNGLAELWVDGTRICSIINKNTAYYGDASQMRFGLPEVDNCAATAVYCDSAKISQQYIGPEISQIMFADGFDVGSFINWSGTSVSTGEKAVLTYSRARQGSYSAMFTSNGGGGSEYAYCYKTITSSSDVYARGYFYVSRSGIVEENDRFNFIVLKAGANNVAYAGWRKTGGVVKWVLTILNGTSNAVTYSSTSPALSRWYSVELHWKNDVTAGQGQLWIDGILVCSITGKNTSAYGDVSRVSFGLPQLYYCGATTAYCDSCVISKTNIGT